MQIGLVELVWIETSFIHSSQCFTRSILFASGKKSVWTPKPQIVMVCSEQELSSKKTSFLNCSEEKPSAHCSASALWLVRCAFANLLIDEWVKEQECYVFSTFLLLFYSFISFSTRAKTNFIETISHLCIRLFLATCWLNTEMISWYDGLAHALNVPCHVFCPEYP